jgi:hypothetical protein
MRSVGMNGRNGSDMIANIIVGIGMIALIGFALYGFYMAIWGVYDEFH